MRFIRRQRTPRIEIFTSTGTTTAPGPPARPRAASMAGGLLEPGARLQPGATRQHREPDLGRPSAPSGPRPRPNRARHTDAIPDLVLTERLRLDDEPRHARRRGGRPVRPRIGRYSGSARTELRNRDTELRTISSRSRTGPPRAANATARRGCASCSFGPTSIVCASWRAFRPDDFDQRLVSAPVGGVAV
jgi:hypothetical protein